MIPERLVFPESRFNPKFLYHIHQMRRPLSILLALLFGLGPLAFAFSADRDAGLPACCRRNGVHHCAMSPQARTILLRAASQAPAFTAPDHCPLYRLHGPANPSSKAAVATARFSPTASAAQTAHRVARLIGTRSIHLRTPALRGPPSLDLV